MLAISIFASVRIVAVEHGSLIARKVPVSVHPATFASPSVVGLAESRFVLIRIRCAVNTLLLGESDRINSISDGNLGLQSDSAAERPAGATNSLLFDTRSFFQGNPIDIVVLIFEAAMLVILKKPSAGPMIIILATKPRHIVELIVCVVRVLVQIICRFAFGLQVQGFNLELRSLPVGLT